MKRITLFALAITVTACAGRAPMPVASYQVGDEVKSCEELRAEIASINQKISMLMPETQKTGKNVALAATGVLLFPPALFFMDLSDAEKIEIQAYQQRTDALRGVMIRRHCDDPPGVMPSPEPQQQTAQQ